ncbi:MAG: SurA N-terminal domain-containing protein [Deltaproteobacteria bacterium]|nr:SurA N-terminal domain-containing protein [Deltaproteobacteria bacterium]
MKNQLVFNYFLSVLIILFTLFGEDQVYSGELADRIVAIVNDDCITLSELNESLKPYLTNIDQGGYPQDVARKMRFDVRQKVLNGLIDQKLSDQEEKKLGISVNKEEVDQYFERTKNDNFMTEEDLKKALEAQGFTWEGYRRQVKDQILRGKLINLEVKSKIAVTEEEIKGFYEKHQADYAGVKQYHLGSIVVRVFPEATDEEIAAAQERAKSIEMMLKTGAEGAFDELAQRFSGDESITSGDLGLFPLDELSEKIRDMVRGMKAGDIIPVMEAPHGYQILVVQEVTETPGKTLDEVKGEIQQKLYQEFVEEKYEAYVKKLRKRSYVKVMQ